MISQKVFDAMAELSDRINVYAHGSTFSGHPVATAVAHESLTIIEEEGLIAHGAEIGNFFLRELADLRDHDMIGDFRGVGALISMEIVADRTTRAGFPAAANVNGILARHCSAEGVLPRLGGDRVVFAPPLVMTFDEAGEAVKRFRRALDATRKEVRAL
jgi:4-aminobutyrate--pyruvate transaminase